MTTVYVGFKYVSNDDEIVLLALDTNVFKYYVTYTLGTSDDNTIEHRIYCDDFTSLVALSDKLKNFIALQSSESFEIRHCKTIDELTTLNTKEQ